MTLYRWTGANHNRRTKRPEGARVSLDELAAKWGRRYPAVIRLWENAWEEFIPFLDYDVESAT